MPIGSRCRTLRGLPARAQAWPSKPIRLVVVYPTGGVSDSVALVRREHESNARIVKAASSGLSR
jgi:tripartite-type tricarboxylate transporter receptor subunit TctC